MNFETLAAKLADYKGIDVNTITLDSTFEDLALDSLDIADLVMQIEDEMGINIELDPEVKDMKALVAKIEEAQA
ncbi:MAG: acyl carrier protein [Clostridia bacterium]|nr:acyl carrier protein [Clostridia bacterium]MBP3653385.1 acyl carrier protein [Clostridia bacterium]